MPFFILNSSYGIILSKSEVATVFQIFITFIVKSFPNFNKIYFDDRLHKIELSTTLNRYPYPTRAELISPCFLVVLWYIMSLPTQHSILWPDPLVSQPHIKRKQNVKIKLLRFLRNTGRLPPSRHAHKHKES